MLSSKFTCVASDHHAHLPRKVDEYDDDDNDDEDIDDVNDDAYPCCQ